MSLPAITEPKRAGRPSDYSLEIVIEICARLSAGEPLSKICRDDHMPGLATVYLWQAKHPEFVEMYARARLAQADTLADEIVRIADEPLVGTRTEFTSSAKDGQSTKVTEADMIEHRKLQVDARKWAASKFRPNKYGDKLDLTNSDGSLAGAWSKAITGAELDKPIEQPQAEIRH